MAVCHGWAEIGLSAVQDCLQFDKLYTLDGGHVLWTLGIHSLTKHARFLPSEKYCAMSIEQYAG